MKDVLLVGHYTHDTLVLEDGSRHRSLGGSAAYASTILSALGARVSVVAKAGEDFAYAAQVGAHAPLVRGPRTTSFVDEYRGGARFGRVDARCEPIEAADVGERARVGLACGVAGEITPGVLTKLRSLCETVACDAQALLRSIDAMGNVGHVRLADTPFAGMLGCIDILKANREEAEYLEIEQVRARTTLIVTEGAAGCTVYTRAGRLRVPGFPAIERDSTGAGDCFLAGFVYGVLRGHGLERSARLANRCGALAVEQVGVPGLDRVSREISAI